MRISELVKDAHALAVKKGWYENDFNVAEKLALIHSEVSEAVEDCRNGAMAVTYSPTGKPCGLPSELADIVIRVADLAAALNIDLEKAVEEKHAYNKTRPYRHGGKAF